MSAFDRRSGFDRRTRPPVRNICATAAAATWVAVVAGLAGTLLGLVLVAAALIANGTTLEGLFHGR